jgi:hypothetical protein
MIEQSPYGCLAELDAKFFGNHVADQLSRPQREGKLVLQEANHRHSHVHPLEHLAVEFGLATV